MIYLFIDKGKHNFIILCINIKETSIKRCTFAGIKTEGRNEQVKASTDATVYCAISSDVIKSYTLKLNVKMQGDKSDSDAQWSNTVFADTGETFKGLPVYSTNFTAIYDGAGKMQFQIYNGSDWVEGKYAFGGDGDWDNDWKSATYFNGKIFNYSLGTFEDYVETTVNFVDGSGVLGEELDYNTSNGQYEGVYTTLEDGEKFKIRKKVGETSTDYALLDSALPEDVATSDGSWVTIVKAGAYMVYFKGDNTMWIQDAEPSLVAYAYAGYFLTNVGCDPNGVATPTGWSDCATRYSNLNDDAKDYIYNFDVSTAESGDDIAAMIARYEWAIKHNPNSLSHFIVNASGTERPISSSNMLTVYKASSNNSNYIPVIAIVASSIAIVSLLGAGLMIKRRKEDK